MALIDLDFTNVAVGSIRRPGTETLSLLADLETTIIGDSQERLYCVDAAIAPVGASTRLVGPAFTVYTPAGDNLAIHRALELVEPGDVLVVNGGGYQDRALIGGIIVEKALKMGLAGIVIDGTVRDLGDLRQSSLPVFARGASPAGPYKNGPGEINHPIACGGVACLPGDVVVGDEDGVVVVPQDRVPDVAAKGLLAMEKEAEILRLLR